MTPSVLPPAGRRVAVVSPHLDDAVLSAWLVLQDEPGTRVITCFAGLPEATATGAWDAVTGSGTGRAAVEARRDEDAKALALTGSRPVHLGLLDRQYRGAQDGDALTGRLAGLLAAELEDADEVWLPAALGGHADHVLARTAALAVTAGHPRRFVYADLPYAGQPAWPSPVTGGLRDRLVAVVDRGLGTATPWSSWLSALHGIPGLRPESVLVRQLTPGQRRAKYRAVAQYGSQTDALRCGRRHPLRRRRIFAYEVAWRLPA